MFSQLDGNPLPPQTAGKGERDGIFLRRGEGGGGGSLFSSKEGGAASIGAEEPLSSTLRKKKKGGEGVPYTPEKKKEVGLGRLTLQKK